MINFTIKQLYDLGQRQFIMRGGGISPELVYHPEKRTKSNNVMREEYFSAAKSELEWEIDGSYMTVYAYENNHCPLDLLPIPLLNFNAHLQAIQAIGGDDERA